MTEKLTEAEQVRLDWDLALQERKLLEELLGLRGWLHVKRQWLAEMVTIQQSIFDAGIEGLDDAFKQTKQLECVRIMKNLALYPERRIAELDGQIEMLKTRVEILERDDV